MMHNKKVHQLLTTHPSTSHRKRKGERCNIWGSWFRLKCSQNVDLRTLAQISRVYFSLSLLSQFGGRGNNASTAGKEQKTETVELKAAYFPVFIYFHYLSA